MSQTTYGACADCGNDARACGRGCASAATANTDARAPSKQYPSTKRRRAVGDACRNGHLIATKDDLIDNCRVG